MRSTRTPRASFRTGRFGGLLAAGLAVSLSACEEPTRPGGVTGVETAIIVNSIELSLSVFPVDSPDAARTIGFAQAGSPVSLAARGNRAVVPLGLLSAAAVIDLATGDVLTVPLPENSGATGAAFLDDSIAYVANPNRNTVSRINVRRGVAESEIAVGVFPQVVAARSGRVLVMNAELDASFRPARQGAISVIDPATDSVIASILLTGFNPSAAAFGPDGRLYVVNSGSFGQGDGSLSVVDLVSLQEVGHHGGFGEFPGAVSFGPDGVAYVSAFSYGIAAWDAVGDTFIRPPSNPIVVEGNATSSGIGFDSSGRLYTLLPGDCVGPSVALRLTPELAFDRAIDVGVCPFAIAFARVLSP